MSEMQEVMVLAKVVDPEERKGGMRLNAEMKREVVEKALEHAFAKRKKKLEADALDVGKAIYHARFPNDVVRLALKLGEPWHRPLHVDTYGSKAATKFAGAHVGGESHTIKVPTNLPFPHGYTISLKGERKELLDKLHAHHDAQKALEEEEKKVSATLTAMLARISTYPSLEKNWPAGHKFYSHLPKKYPFRHQVPAVLIDELNAALGI